MSRPAPLVSMHVGIVVERRAAKSPWIDHVWRPVAALPGVPTTPSWTVIGGDGEAVRFFAGAAELGLYRSDTAQYRDNVASGNPGLWVVLRPTGREPPFEVIAVTADPSEGEAFSEGGADLVEPVPIPEPVLEMINAFVAEHHVERTFTKRKRKPADPDAMERRGLRATRAETKDRKP